MSATDKSKQVKAHYEALPYPPRNPADEKKRLVHGFGGSLVVINHYCFGGKLDVRKNFRCLVAGGGTGDCVVYLAEQLRHFDAEIIYVDFSSASRRVAEARANVRGLQNITWITGSIEELPELDLGQFDYINCSGVLHHLESPDDGLTALNEVLKPDGAMCLMLYGRYGRRAVYEAQALLRAVLPEQATHAEKIAAARTLLGNLPETNSFRRDWSEWAHEISTDAGLYDLLLHSQDVAFTVPDIYQYLERANLRLLGFSGTSAKFYNPLNYIENADLRALFQGMDLRQLHTAGELLAGNLSKHEFFAGKAGATTASVDDEDNALLAYGQFFHNAPKIAKAMVAGRTLKYEDSGRQFHLPCDEVARVVLANMDGQTPLRELYTKISVAIPALAPDEIRVRVAALFQLMHAAGFAYLAQAHNLGTCLPDLGHIRKNQESDGGG